MNTETRFDARQTVALKIERSRSIGGRGVLIRGALVRAWFFRWGIIVAIGLFPGAGWAADYLNQHRAWNHTSSGLNDAYLQASSVDKYHPDTSFNHDNDNEFFLYASGDGTSWWNQAILIAFGWDSLFGYGPTRIPNPSQLDSCTIDSGWLHVRIPAWGAPYSNVVQVTAYRVFTEFDYDGPGELYPSWNHSRSGQHWRGGGALTRGDLYGEDSSTVTINSSAEIRIPVTGIFQDFTDSTSRRTGICVGVRFADPDADSTACFYTEAYIGGDANRMYLELWWSEYGVNSSEPDSQKVLVRDAAIHNYFDDPLDYTHFNYGAATTLEAGTSAANSVQNGRVLFDVSGLTDSLADNLGIDSARCYFYIDAKTGSSLTMYAHKLKRWWTEGPGTPTQAVCGADWAHSQHGTTGECATSYGWATAGAAGTTDRESSAFDTVNADTGWQYIWVPDSVATGFYADRDKNNSARTNYTGVLLRMASESANRVRLRSRNYLGTNFDPYWIIYYQQEAAALPSERRPAGIDELYVQGAQIR